MDKPRIFWITGLSGAGKTSVVNALEDIGFLCIDNLPFSMMEQVLSLSRMSSHSIPGIAIVMDIRNARLNQFSENTIRTLKKGFNLEIIFVDASDESIIRRFKQTHRIHPLILKSRLNLSEAIRQERNALAEIRRHADHKIDTSKFNIHDIRKLVQGMIRPDLIPKPLIHLMSFGFKFGAPTDMEYIFDVRFLPNPYFDENLKNFTGLDKNIQNFLHEKDLTVEFLTIFRPFVTFVLKKNHAGGRINSNIAIGCTGGKHRSVTIVEWLSTHLKSLEFEVNLLHRDIEKL